MEKQQEISRRRRAIGTVITIGTVIALGAVVVILIAGMLG